MVDEPFDTIESAHDFVKRLREQVMLVESEVSEDIAVAVRATAARRLDALRVVHHNLKQLNAHLGAASRVLNDLRVLRRMLTGEASEPRRAPLPVVFALDKKAPARAAVDA